MPPNNLATHLNNYYYHSNVRHPPYYFPRGAVGYNFWTPSRPGLNHLWHINRLHAGGPWGPNLLSNAINNPNKYNIGLFNRNMLNTARWPVMNTYAYLNTGVAGPTPYLLQRLPPHLPIWQYYQRQNPGFKYLCLATPPDLRVQLALREQRLAAQRGQAPGAFPFGGMDAFDPRAALNGMPRSTLDRVTTAVSSLLGRQGPEPIPGFPAGFPRSTPTVRSFPGMETGMPADAAPDLRERTESAAELAKLRREVTEFVRTHAPLPPATQRGIGILVASMDQAMNSPTLNRGHVASSRMFWDQIVGMERVATPEGGLPAPEPGADETEPA